MPIMPLMLCMLASEVSGGIESMRKHLTHGCNKICAYKHVHKLDLGLCLCLRLKSASQASQAATRMAAHTVTHGCT